MSRSRVTIGAALLACFLSLGACAAQVRVRQQDVTASFSDGRFQVEWETAQTKKGSPLIAGYVQNTRGGGVANVRLRVDTLDAQGQIIGTATALAPGYVGGFSRTYVEVPVTGSGLTFRHFRAVLPH